MTKKVPLTEELVEQLELHDPTGCIRQLWELSKQPHANTDFYAILAKDELLGAGGVIEHNKGCGEVFFFSTPEGRGRKAFSCIKIAKRFVKEKLDNEFHRIQSFVSPALPDAMRMNELIGMEKEGMLHSYTGPGEDYWRYAIWRQEQS